MDPANANEIEWLEKEISTLEAELEGRNLRLRELRKELSEKKKVELRKKYAQVVCDKCDGVSQIQGSLGASHCFRCGGDGYIWSMIWDGQKGYHKSLDQINLK
jgi:hypothetical protein